MKFTRRQVLIVTLIASLVAAGVLLRSGPAWKIGLDVPVAIDSALNVHRVQFKRGDASFEALIARMPRNGVRATLVDVAQSQPLSDLARANGAMLAINAGYFDQNFQPVGLLRVDGRETGTLLAQPPLSGLVVINAAGEIDIANREFTSLSNAASAFQAGPFLIEPGGNDGIRGSDAKAAERTILAISGANVFVIVTTPVTLADLADALLAAPVLGGPSFDRAINLDGGPSSGFVVDVPGSHMQRLPRGPIRNALLFAPAQ